MKNIFTKTAIKHRIRVIKQLLINYDVAIIGGYHGYNLGDIALGVSVKEALKKRNLSATLQTLYSLNSKLWRTKEYAILGGGAIGYTDSLLKLSNKYKDNFKNISILGVDFNEPDYKNEKVSRLIKDSLWVSTRNKVQADSIKMKFGRSDVIVHPDIAFSLYTKFCKEVRVGNSRKEKILLVNLVPLYGLIKDGKIISSSQYERERPDLYRNFHIMQQSYRDAVRKVVSDALKDGYKVESLPFTPNDAKMAELFFIDMDVKLTSYSDNPKQVIRKMSKASKVLATRYHATIFAAKLNLEVIPLAYAKKNEYLLEELGISRNSYLTVDDLAKGRKVFPVPITFSPEIVDKWETRSQHAIDKCIDRILESKSSKS